ncbi:PREDICTED: chymotrypsin-2-like [Ceratosolen solmsi marchali]|uniref:Chymotrypsin-2-like n=1 Tax=Ceratosolen solmsi marchali TaxID=326594 RepID=A0AAJ6YVP0_9HYME|nr:PREDICTED: chymotrypsin-2-like [Ceratosolen solmsi marchali]
MNIQLIIFLCFTPNIILVVFAKNVKIIGGVDADIKEIPYIASLRQFKKEEHFCSGAIISHYHILTAAHCIDSLDKSEVRIYVGSANSSNYTGPYYNIQDIKMHPKYNKANIKKLKTRYDIAVLTVYPRIPFNQFQNKINLPNQDIETGELGLISGWGWKTYPIGWISDTLQKLSMWIISNEQCANYFTNLIREEHICVYRNRETGTCFGDSGGPLINNNTLIGISSINSPCASGDPDVYVRVYTFLEFINSIINCHCVPFDCNCL